MAESEASKPWSLANIEDANKGRSFKPDPVELHWLYLDCLKRHGCGLICEASDESDSIVFFLQSSLD